MVESACMMLDFIDEQEIAKNIRKAVAEVVLDGKVKTYDMAKMTGKADVVEKGATSTIEMANAIIAKL
jgi:3-isopropylmalate dehydrogenase